jgi:transcriptional regulator with XRE-family HTH domain
MKPIDTGWFKGLLTDRQISQRQLAFKMNMDPASMSLMLRGKRRMTLDDAEKLSRELKVRVDEILFHAGVRGLGPGESPGLVEHKIRDLK